MYMMWSVIVDFSTRSVNLLSFHTNGMCYHLLFYHE